MSPQRVLVTGGGGFVGSAIAAGFARMGREVVALDRSFDGGSALDGVTRVVADLVAGVPGDVGAFDLVVHAAWITSALESLGISDEAYLDLNLAPLRAALDHAASSKPTSFVFLSSSGVFAPTDGDGAGLRDDDEPTGAHPYARAKSSGERLVLGAGAPAARHVVRLGYLYGPSEAIRPSRDRLSLVATWLAAARSGRPLEVRSDDPARDWTFVGDLASAIDRVVAAGPAGRALHLGSPDVLRDSEIALRIAAAFEGVELVSVEPEAPVKPPMIPSDVEPVRDHGWTGADDGLRSLVADAVGV